MAGPQAPVFGAIVAAGGGSRRFGFDKLFAPLGHLTVLERAVRALAEHSRISAIVLAVRPDAVERADFVVSARRLPKVVAIVPAGSRRRASIAAALAALPALDWVVVHDAARPLLPPVLLTAVLDAALAHGAAAAASPVTDTVKLADATEHVACTPDRSRLRSLQTPQAFRRDLLARAHRQADPRWTDDAAMVASLGHPVHLVPGLADNLKITYPIDLELAEAALRGRG